jgi:hypothetical protein
MTIADIGQIIRLIFVYKFNIQKMKNASRLSDDKESDKNLKTGGVFLIVSFIFVISYGFLKYSEF